MRRRIHDAQERSQQHVLALIAGLDSGDPIEITAEYWEKKRWELIERHAPRQS